MPLKTSQMCDKTQQDIRKAKHTRKKSCIHSPMFMVNLCFLFSASKFVMTMVRDGVIWQQYKQLGVGVSKV